MDYAWALLSVKAITMALGNWGGSEHMLVSSVVPPDGFSEAFLSPQTFFLFMMGRTALSWTLFLCLFLRGRLIHFLAWCCWVLLQTQRNSGKQDWEVLQQNDLNCDTTSSEYQPYDLVYWMEYFCLVGLISHWWEKSNSSCCLLVVVKWWRMLLQLSQSSIWLPW